MCVCLVKLSKTSLKIQFIKNLRNQYDFKVCDMNKKSFSKLFITCAQILVFLFLSQIVFISFTYLSMLTWDSFISESI